MLTNVSPRTLAIQQLREMIKTGRVGPGDRLPSEQRLASMVEVSRGTIRAALEHLEHEGLVVSEKYRGRRVASSARSSSNLLAGTLVLLSRSADAASARGHAGYMAAIDEAAIEFAHEAGLHVLALHPNGSQEKLFDDVLRDRPRGILITHKLAETDVGRQILERLHAARLPVVLNGDEPALARFDRVVSDHEQGAYELTRWLIQQGRRRILRLWPAAVQSSYWIRARDAGHERALAEAGLTPLPPVQVHGLAERSDAPDERTVFGVRVRQVAGFLIEHFTADPPDAIMCATDGQVFLAAAACRLYGRAPGRDVLLAGYDNYWSDCWERQYEPTQPDVSVDKCNHDTGRAMMQLLLDRTAGRLPAQPQRLVVMPRLVPVQDKAPVSTGQRDPRDP